MYGSSAEAEQVLSGASSSSSGAASAVSNPMMVKYCAPTRSDSRDARERVAGVKGIGKGMSMKRRRHISIERQRRAQMNSLLESLQALLPDPTPRKDRCTLLIDIINYLQSLEKKIGRLATCKAEIMSSLTCQAKTNVKPNKVATFSMPLHHKVSLKNFHVHVFKVCKPMNAEEEIILTFMSPSIKGLFSQILMLFNLNQIKVINATTSRSSDSQMLHYFHAQVPKSLNLEGDDLKVLFSSSNCFA